MVLLFLGQKKIIILFFTNHWLSSKFKFIPPAQFNIIEEKNGFAFMFL